MELWQHIDKMVWQGRDDSAESPMAKRLFQTIIQAPSFSPQDYPDHIALLGFECDEGVRLNKGRVGAKEAPNMLRKALANMADHGSAKPVVDLGNIQFSGDSLDAVQNVFASCITKCHQLGLPTLVLGGGHETAYAHGKGIFEAYPTQKIGVINFDAHLDIRTAEQGTSGTPFKQLYQNAQLQAQDFHYLCIGASLPGNTAALLHTATEMGVEIIWDSECHPGNFAKIAEKIAAFMSKVDIIYLTIDLDALPFSEMFAVSAPSAYGVSMKDYLHFADQIMASGKLRAVDFVEYNPSLDRDQLSAKTAARMIWHFYHQWQG